MENENILTFFAVIFIAGFFIILPVQATDNFYLNATEEVRAQETITGIITIPAGSYEITDKIELSIETNKESETLYNLLNKCENQECELGAGYYSASGQLQTTSSGTDFQVGIPFPKNSIILSSELSLTLSSSPPALEPELNLGSDTVDWIYPGTPGIDYKQPIGITTISQQEDLITINCEKLSTTKTTEIRLSTYVKASEKPLISVFNDDEELIYSKECNNEPIDNYDWLKCNLYANDMENNADVFNSGEYYFCISSPAEDRIKYTTQNQSKQGYVYSVSFNSINGDYLIYIEPKQHDSYLRTETTITVSNQDGTPFITKLAEYIDSCTYTTYNEEEQCIIPISIKSKDTNQVTISGLELSVLTQEGRGLIISQFATDLEEKQASKVNLLSDKIIDLSKINLKAPLLAGNYSLKATLKSYEDTTDVLIKAAPSLSLKQVKEKFDLAYNNYNSYSEQVKEIYQDLGVNIETIKITLENYENNPELEDPIQVQNIAETTPEEITLQDSVTIKPFLLYADLTSLYPYEKEDTLATLQRINEKIGREYKARLLKVKYLTGTTESFVLIKKTFSTQAPLQEAYVIENIPEALASTLLIEPIKEIPVTIDPQTLTYKFYSFVGEVSFVYRLNSDSLALIPDIITIISPSPTPSQLSTELLEFDCPNGICNPGEDYLSCPEDCTCGNNKCEKKLGETPKNCPKDCTAFPWTALIISLLILIIGGAIALITLKPGYLQSIPFVQKLTSLLKIKPAFSSQEEFGKLVNYIRSAKAKKISKKEIEEALLKKGWKEKQVKYASRRAR